MYNFEFIPKSDNISFTYDINQISDGITDLRIKLKYKVVKAPDEFVVKWAFPVHEFLSVWTPLADNDCHLGTNWGPTCSGSRLAVGAPVLACLDGKGDNILTVGVSDAKSPIDIDCGIIEETAEVVFFVSFFVSPASPISDYTATIRLDSRSSSFVDTVMGIEQWWEQDCGYKHAYVPEAARIPMNSAWYSFHQDLNSERLLHECKLSASCGLKTIIIDDGWQTDDNNRGYAYCGDWELCKKKIPDMAELTKGIHDLGMKVMLWYSVPFVGKYSKVYSRFKDKALTYGRQPNTIVLDPRYPDVRKYLTDIYRNALTDWNLDGFKLDFIDDFRIYPETKPFSEGMDIVSVEDAVDVLLYEITSTLKAINPDILIEFRQGYIGPSILKYGNMVRVGDCPYDSRRNRCGIVNLRLTSGDSAVHSDMLMWHPQDSVEGACIQIISTLFGVPQISVLLDEIPESHKKALSFWMDFYMKHRETLSGKLSVKNPEIGYTQVTASKGRKAVTVNYAPVTFELKNVDEHIFINSSFEQLVSVNSDENYIATVYNCTGDKIKELTVSVGLTAVNVPVCGFVEFTVEK